MPLPSGNADEINRRIDEQRRAASLNSSERIVSTAEMHQRPAPLPVRIPAQPRDSGSMGKDY